MCYYKRCCERRLAFDLSSDLVRRLNFGLASDLAQRLEFGLASDLALVLASGVGLKLKLMEDLDLGKVLAMDSFRIFERKRDLDTWEVGNDVGVSNLEFEEMEVRFTLPPFENPDHYWY